MSHWNSTRASPDRPAPLADAVARLFQTLADANAAVAFDALDANGQVVASGRCRLQEFLAEERRLVVDLPTVSGQPMPVAVGQSAIVLFELNGSRYQGDTVVLERALHQSPSGLGLHVLHLRAPEKLTSGNRRRSFRVEPLTKSMPTVQWRPAAGGHNPFPLLGAVVKDVSCRGIGLILPAKIGEKLRDGLELELDVKLPHEQSSLALRGLIRRIVPLSSDPTRCLVGIEFLADDDACEEVPELARFVVDCQREIARIRSGER